MAHGKKAAAAGMKLGHTEAPIFKLSTDPNIVGAYSTGAKGKA